MQRTSAIKICASVVYTSITVRISLILSYLINLFFGGMMVDFNTIDNPRENFKKLSDAWEIIKFACDLQIAKIARRQFYW